MIITKMALPRRTFLRGMGAILALPLLDAMVPALSVAASAASAPAKMAGTNLGSTAFITCVASCSRATDATTSGSDASICAVANRAATSSPCLAAIHSTVRWARDSS